ncbi:NAD(P)-dependent oxidoreductase [Pediococcus siamensis]|uniref:NAD(P)-dependent oxidoreductase n=1 Tax=Pediococcus siamensis TaxID=381829 RepID=UPI0039A08EA2
MENLLILPHNSELDFSAYRQLGVNVFTTETIKPKDYAAVTIMLGWQNPLSETILNTPNANLKWVQTISAGVDYLPLSQLKEHHILVTNMSGVHATPISQTVLLYALYFMRDLPQVLVNNHKRYWTPQKAFENAFTLDQLNWTIFGTGHIGRELARVLKPFGTHVVGVNRTGHPAENFEQTFAQANWRAAIKDADIVVNIMPLTAETTHFFDHTFFEALHNLYLFMNVGRGKSVATDALLVALQNQNVLHAALDVFETEPLEESSSLWQTPNVLITPHYSAQRNQIGAAWHQIFLANLQKFLTHDKHLKNVVNFDQGY